MIVRLDDDEVIDAPPGRDPWGLHGKDEVWEGVYCIMPIADIEHQQVATTLAAALVLMIQLPGLGEVYAGSNVSDRAGGWTKNYRIPDLSVFVAGTTAENHGTHWRGGPDFAAEVLSDDDHAREKLGFYATNGVRELLIIDRDPWRLELYRLDAGTLGPAGTSTPASPDPLASLVLPLSFRLPPGDPRPRIEVTRVGGDLTWSV